MRIQQDEIRDDAPGEGQRFLAALGEMEVAHGRQRVAQDVDGGRVVVDDQDARRQRAWRSLGIVRHGAAALQVLDQQLRPQVCMDPGRQLGGDQRLGHEIGGALAQGDHLQRRRVVTRREDDRHVRQGRIRFQFFEDVEARHARHLDVHEDEIRRRLARQPEGHLTRRGEPLIAELRQHAAHDLDGRRVVVDQQQADFTG